MCCVCVCVHVFRQDVHRSPPPVSHVLNKREEPARESSSSGSQSTVWTRRPIGDRGCGGGLPAPVFQQRKLEHCLDEKTPARAYECAACQTPLPCAVSSCRRLDNQNIPNHSLTALRS